MSIMTVNGPISNKEAGVVAPHEHIYIDITNQAPVQDTITHRILRESKVDLSTRGKLARNPYYVLDNLRLNEEHVAVEELIQFKAAGGSTLVDVTPHGIGRDPVAVKRVSDRSGVHVVMGCGFYTGDTHPAFVEDSSANDLADIMLSDIQEGINGTRIRAGVIGEIGTSTAITNNEEKVVHAAGIAQAKSGLGLHLHTYPWGKEGLRAIELLKKRGADMHKVAINHIDVEIDLDYCLSLINSGAFIEFDNFGKEFYIDSFDRKDFVGGVFMTDVERVKSIKYLIEKGCTDHILVTCDVCLKSLLHSYGGWGYDHILSHIVPMMRDFNIKEDDIETIIDKNPIKFLGS